MLELDMANRFVEQISAYTEYNVNIMNERGIIIASRDPSRIGTHHETAYKMLKEDTDIAEVTGNDSYFGVKNGVNLLVYDGKTPVGVVGVTGMPEKVRDIALIIKMAFENMIRYERKREILYSTRTIQESFFNALFIEESPERSKLEELARSLHFSASRIRIPILLAFSEQYDQNPPGGGYKCHYKQGGFDLAERQLARIDL